MTCRSNKIGREIITLLIVILDNMSSGGLDRSRGLDRSGGLGRGRGLDSGDDFFLLVLILILLILILLLLLVLLTQILLVLLSITPICIYEIV